LLASAILIEKKQFVITKLEFIFQSISILVMQNGSE